MNNPEKLLSAREKKKLEKFKDSLKYIGKNSYLSLIAVDDSELGKSFIHFIEENSPLKTEVYPPKSVNFFPDFIENNKNGK